MFTESRISSMAINTMMMFLRLRTMPSTPSPKRIELTTI